MKIRTRHGFVRLDVVRPVEWPTHTGRTWLYRMTLRRYTLRVRHTAIVVDHHDRRRIPVPLTWPASRWDAGDAAVKRLGPMVMTPERLAALGRLWRDVKAGADAVEAGQGTPLDEALRCVDEAAE